MCPGLEPCSLKVSSPSEDGQGYLEDDHEEGEGQDAQVAKDADALKEHDVRSNTMLI